MNLNRINFILIVMLVLKCATIFSVIEAGRDINNLLINDLNIIATKIDEIPETSLNLKLVLMAYECNDVKLSWKISPSQSTNKKTNIFDYQPSVINTNQQLSKIFGYQVVVREYLEPKTAVLNQNTNNNNNKQSSYNPSGLVTDKTVRVYSSKYFSSTQNKFKLINLLRRDLASYLICLVIYIDVTETVAFEKQCVNFSLPNLPENVENACQKLSASGNRKNNGKNNGNKKLSHTTTTTTSTKSLNLSRNLNRTSGITESPHMNNSNVSNRPNTSSNYNRNNETNLILSQSKMHSIRPSTYNSNYQCEHLNQCRHYSNLLIAFVVCGVLLGTNVFMFTIIIIQNTIKLGLLKHKLKAIKQSQRIQSSFANYQLASNSNINFIEKDSGDKAYLNSDSSRELDIESASSGSFFKCFKHVSFKKAIKHSCRDVFELICCCSSSSSSSTKKNSANKSGDKNRHFDNFKQHEFRLDNDLSTNCTTITRPGYILQVPNATISNASSLMNLSEKSISFFNNSSAMTNKSNTNSFFAKSEILSTNFAKRHNFNNFQFHHQHDNMNQQKQQHHHQLGGQKEKHQLSDQFHQNSRENDDDLNSIGFDSNDIKNMENFDGEVFYHIPPGKNIGPQVSSAF